jgi:hypothetical protein
LYLKTGDLLHLQFRHGRIDLLDRAEFAARGALAAPEGVLVLDRAELARDRRNKLEIRARRIAPSNRMLEHTDAAHGVIPRAVAEWAIAEWVDPTLYALGEYAASS